MRDFEIEMFAKALKYAQDEFYLDAINELKALVENYPNSELVDDALFNVGLCYFNLGHYEKAIQEFENLITNFPDATISVLEGGDEYGMPLASNSTEGESTPQEPGLTPQEEARHWLKKSR